VELRLFNLIRLFHISLQWDRKYPTLPILNPTDRRCRYDAILRIFDTRSPRQPICTLDVGGGIWRVKWHPTKSSRLLIAAMHGGCCVVDFEGLEGVDGGSDTEVRATVLKRFDGHESMAYGVDWGAPIPSRGEDMVASCSFYDHVVHLWSA
jgi:diphthamide biosynthesis protein 7